MNSEFEAIGYFKEYYVNSKFIGTLNCELGDREIGYNGRLGEIVFDRIVLSNRRVIKAGTLTTTIVYPLCGKLKKAGPVK